ncbi:MAG: shikimate dehydrogenase, partial [Saprospiraceae bacterium]
RKFGLIGFPLTHSFSRKFFSQKFEKELIHDAEYRLYPIDSIHHFPDLIKGLGPELVGLNVTIPYKQSVIQYLDDLSQEAQQIQAVNTILFRDGKLLGYNTDIPGFEQSLLHFIDEQVITALVLGNGGASKAVQFVLSKLHIHFKTVSRNPKPGSVSYEQLDDTLLQTSRLIINTTPLGMAPKTTEFPAFDYSVLSDQHYLYDLIYNPTKTIFLSKGEAQGSKIQNGLDMLYRQAEASWKIWNQ